MQDNLQVSEDVTLPLASTAFLVHLKKLIDHEQSEMDRKEKTIPGWDPSTSNELSRMMLLHGLYHKIALAHAIKR